MANMLTTKELEVIQDLLIYEENACKKAKIYSKILTNVKLAETSKKLYENHKSRFETLLGLL